MNSNDYIPIFICRIVNSGTCAPQLHGPSAEAIVVESGAPQIGASEANDQSSAGSLVGLCGHRSWKTGHATRI